MFENEVGKLDTDSIEQMDRLIDFIREAKLGIVQMDQWRNFIRSDEFKQIQDLRREARNENTTDARKDEIEAEIEDVFAGMKDIYEEFYNDMLDIYSEIKGANWRTSIQESHVGDPVANGGPSQDFTKKRALPPEADKILEKYYVSDPMKTLQPISWVRCARQNITKGLAGSAYLKAKTPIINTQTICITHWLNWPARTTAAIQNWLCSNPQ